MIDGARLIRYDRAQKEIGMPITIPLEKMTIPDKLRAMEDIWDDLLRQPLEIPSPSWHEDVLNARAARVRKGVSKYHDWPKAKERIRKMAK